MNVMTAAMMSLAVAGCAPDLGGTGAAVETAAPSIPLPPPGLVAGAYVERADPRYVIPALPVAEIPVEFQRQSVDYDTDQAVGTIIINTAEKHLYLITGNDRALRYGIAVGRAGFSWSGEAVIAEHKQWPTWIPPYEMIDRRPELEEFRDVGQPGGPSNPLGARALYLLTNGVDYGYRIHGTPEWESIGKNASSGCIRMINQDVMDLFDRVPDGTKVIVLTADGQMPTELSLPPPAPKKPKPAAPAAPPPPAPIDGPF